MRATAFFKNKLFYIVLFLFSLTQSYSQCSFEYNDSFKKRKVLEQNWNNIKFEFIPEDLKKFPLIFQRFSDENYENKINVQKEKLLRKDTTCSCLEGNYSTMWYNEDWIEKYYKGEYTFKNIDSIQDFNPEKFPYVMMCYNTLDYFSNGYGSGRVGVYIWDRRTDKKYKVISVCGKSEMVWFLKNI
ncbi:MAG: hypothetical protein RLZZ175_1092 [Bacteroidota bacterium]|jgi:hypothetical protein